MHRRLMVAWAAVGLTFCAVTMQAVVLPGRVVACSCSVLAIPSLLETRTDADTAVFTGMAGRQVEDRVPITVENWFHGPGEADVIWLRARDIPIGENEVMTNTCGLDLVPGELRFFVVRGEPPEPFSATRCALGAQLDSPEGQRLVTEAMAVFGSTQAPTSTESESAPPAGPSPWIGEGLTWAAAAAGAGMMLLGAIVLIARRRPAR